MSITPTASVSMREFLRTGEFGSVRLGDSVDSLRSVLGEPPVVGGSSRRPPGIWKYGDIEFHLSSDARRVCLIFCDTFERLQLGPAASFDRWFFEGHPPVELVERELASDVRDRTCHTSHLPFCCVSTAEWSYCSVEGAIP